VVDVSRDANKGEKQGLIYPVRVLDFPSMQSSLGKLHWQK
jgi:hypothetical protein